MKILTNNVNDMSTLKEVMQLLQEELKSTSKEFCERLYKLQKISPFDFNPKERLERHSTIIMTIKNVLKNLKLMVDNSED